MTKVSQALSARMKQTESPKMSAMSLKSASGGLSSFSGVFAVAELSAKEKQELEELFKQYAEDGADFSEDLRALSLITSEVKAINNQAAILHGERIKKAHTLLTKYRDGAFTTWLMRTYGNRQTPYNLMQYFEFYEALPKTLRPQIEVMPRQAIYSLASRDGDFNRKLELVENYQGETKQELLEKIRVLFPVQESDGRKQNAAAAAIKELKKVCAMLAKTRAKFSSEEKLEAKALLEKIEKLL